MYLRQPVDASSVDFAKQMLVLLGTLATSVASFYFGSNTASSAHADASNAAAKIAADASTAARGGTTAGVPVLTNLTTSPTPVARDANGAASFTLNLVGTNLNDVKTVRIESGNDKFSATA